MFSCVWGSYHQYQIWKVLFRTNNSLILLFCHEMGAEASSGKGHFPEEEKQAHPWDTWCVEALGNGDTDGTASICSTCSGSVCHEYPSADDQKDKWMHSLLLQLFIGCAWYIGDFQVIWCSSFPAELWKNSPGCSPSSTVFPSSPSECIVPPGFRASAFV